MAIVLVLLVYALPRVIFSPAADDSGSILNRFQEVDRLRHLSAFARPVIVHWGFSGVLAIMGIVLVSKEWGWTLAVGFGALMIGAVISSFFANDIGRMFSILSPLMVIGCGYLFMNLRGKSGWILKIWGFVLIARIFWIPTILSSNADWVLGSIYPRLFVGMMQILLILGIAVALNSELRRAGKEHFNFLKNFVGLR
jgi:hypothetical protein